MRMSGMTSMRMPMQMNASMSVIVLVSAPIPMFVRVHLSYSMRRLAPAHSQPFLITQFDTSAPRMH